MKMKKIFAVIMALVFTLGIAGLSFSAEKGTPAMKHDDVKICGNINCCGAQEKAKEAVSDTKAGAKSLSSWTEQLKIGADGPTIR